MHRKLLAQREKLKSLLDDINKALSSVPSSISPSIGALKRKRGRPPKKAAENQTKHTLSPESRARIAEAQKKRWA